MMSEIDMSVLKNLEGFRKVCAVNERFGECYVFFYSVLGGGCGVFFYLDDPFYGFCLFAWGILLMYVVLIVAFSYNESLKKNCLLLINEQ